METVGNLYKAVYWKNGTITHLDSGSYGARAFGIAAANGHVYVAGFTGSSTGNDVATLWTDGVPLALTSSNVYGVATAVTVSDGDIYVAGYEDNIFANPFNSKAEYWKNGTRVVLASTSTGAETAAIAVEGADIYVAGTVTGHVQTGPSSYTNEPIATVWKNGVATSLTDGFQYSSVTGLQVSGGHVYVSGSYCQQFIPDCSIAAYWADDKLIPLQTAPFSEASGIALVGSTPYVSLNLRVPGGNLPEQVAGNTVVPLASDVVALAQQTVSYASDIYIAGYDYYGPGYWKDRSFTYLTGAQGGQDGSVAYGIAVVPSSD